MREDKRSSAVCRLRLVLFANLLAFESTDPFLLCCLFASSAVVLSAFLTISTSCHTVSHLFVCIPNCLLLSVSFYFSVCMSASSERSVLNGLIECKQCPRYQGQVQPASHSGHPATTACDVWPAHPIHLYSSPSSSSLHLLFLFLPPFSPLLLLICPAFGHLSLFSPPICFLSPCSPSRFVSFPSFLLSPPISITPHQEEPNRKSKFLVEEWSGA